MLLNFIVTNFNTKTPDFLQSRNLGSSLPRPNDQQEVLGTLSCEMSASKLTVLRCLLDSFPAIPLSIQLNTTITLLQIRNLRQKEKIYKNRGQMKTSQLYKGSSNSKIVSATAK